MLLYFLSLHHLLVVKCSPAQLGWAGPGPGPHLCPPTAPALQCIVRQVNNNINPLWAILCLHSTNYQIICQSERTNYAPMQCPVTCSLARNSAAGSCSTVSPSSKALMLLLWTLDCQEWIRNKSPLTLPVSTLSLCAAATGYLTCCCLAVSAVHGLW